LNQRALVISALLLAGPGAAVGDGAHGAHALPAAMAIRPAGARARAAVPQAGAAVGYRRGRTVARRAGHLPGRRHGFAILPSGSTVATSRSSPRGTVARRPGPPPCPSGGEPAGRSQEAAAMDRPRAGSVGRQVERYRASTLGARSARAWPSSRSALLRARSAVRDAAPPHGKRERRYRSRRAVRLPDLAVRSTGVLGPLPVCWARYRFAGPVTGLLGPLPVCCARYRTLNLRVVPGLRVSRIKALSPAPLVPASRTGLPASRTGLLSAALLVPATVPGDRLLRRWFREPYRVSCLRRRASR
jgi:hypothetical protein